MHLHSDNSCEYATGKLDKTLKQRRIIFENTDPYAPQQSVIYEKTNRILMDMECSMIQCMEVPDSFWSDSITTATHVQNLTASSSIK